MSSSSTTAASAAKNAIATTTSSSSSGPATNGGNSKTSSNLTSTSFTAIWDMNVAQLDSWIKTHRNSKNGSLDDTKALWSNLQASLQSLELVGTETVEDVDDDDDAAARLDAAPKNRKRRRKFELRRYRDPYRVWLQQPERNDDDDTEFHINISTDDDVPSSMGGVLTELSLGGLLNGMAHIPGGLVTRKWPVLPKDTTALDAQLAAASSFSLTYLPLHTHATAWHRAVNMQVRSDLLVTTPARIQALLVPDLDATEFASIRRRVHETAVLGKGLHAGDADDGTAANLVVAQSAPIGSQADVYQACPTCGNKTQADFVLDRKNGDVVCSHCGTVVASSLMHEGSAYRKFEGEADRNHHGDAANPLLSNSHNMSTTLGGVMLGMNVGGAGGGGFGSSGGANAGKRNLETILRNAHAYTELNVSQFGSNSKDRKTRIGYKDKQKREAFINMAHVGDALNLHDAVVQRAKEMFASFRDDRELVQQFKGVLAACLCEAFEQLSTQGRQILKQEQQRDEEQQQAQNEARYGASSRAARRNQLHQAALAGKGGLLLDFDGLQQQKEADAANNSSGAGITTMTPSSAAGTPPPPSSHQSNQTMAAAPYKLAATWDLEDCRTWLLEASRCIAQDWVVERNRGDNGANKRDIPAGSLEELEGMLVEHSIHLCEFLEAELQKHVHSKSSRGSIKTPRVADMSKLGIKWQHQHERGSGGKGGVGGNGVAAAYASAATTAATASRRTAGQVLIMQSAKKFGAILGNPVAGDAIHKELRAVVAKQEARKLKERQDEASRQRLQQMKRKPWLQKRIEA